MDPSQWDNYCSHFEGSSGARLESKHCKNYFGGVVRLKTTQFVLIRMQQDVKENLDKTRDTFVYFFKELKRKIGIYDDEEIECIDHHCLYIVLHLVFIPYENHLCKVLVFLLALRTFKNYDLCYDTLLTKSDTHF